MQTPTSGESPQQISDAVLHSMVEPALDLGVGAREVAQLLGAFAGFACLRAATDALTTEHPDFATLANPIVSIGLSDGSTLLSGDAINRPLLEAPDSFAASLSVVLQERGAAAPDIHALVARKAGEMGSAAFWTAPGLPAAAPLAREALDRVRPSLPILAGGEPRLGPTIAALTTRSFLARFPRLPVDELATLARIVLETAIVTSKVDLTSTWEPEAERRARLASGHLDAGRPDRALLELEPLLTLGPSDPTMLAVVARAALAAGDRDRAVGLALEANRLAADDRGSSLIEQVRTAIGAADWAAAARAACRRASDDWRAHAVVIEADLEAGAVHDGTMDHVAAMFRLAPDQPRVQIVAGRVAAARHRTDEARRRFEEAARLNPGDARAPELLAELDAGRLRDSTTARVPADRRDPGAQDAAAYRIADGLVTRVLAGPVLGPIVVAFLFWHQMRPRWDAPADWPMRTIAHDLPWLLAAPLLVVLISVVQAVRMHRVTRGGIWRTVRTHRGSRLLAIMSVLAAATFALDVATLTMPFATARPLLLVAIGTAGALLFGAILVGGVLGRRLQRRGDVSGPAARRVADWTGIEPAEVRPRIDPRLLVVLFMPLLVVVPVGLHLVAIAVSRMNGPADLDPTTSIALERPWLVPLILLAVLLVAVAGRRAHRAGAPVGPALRRPSGVLALIYGGLLTAAVIAAAAAPLWTGQRLILLLAVPQVLAVLIGGPVFLVRMQAMRRRRA